jgi:uncharacterized protein
MTSAPALICPKCRGAMRSYERNGVVIDHCEECRGIFLDRGELERLIDAEGQAASGAESREHNHHGHHDNDAHDGDDRHETERRRRRRSSPATFLQDFLGGGE